MKEMFDLDREDLACLVAAHISGVEGSIPEQIDFDIADEMIKLMEKLIAAYLNDSDEELIEQFATP